MASARAQHAESVLGFTRFSVDAITRAASFFERGGAAAKSRAMDDVWAADDFGRTRELRVPYQSNDHASPAALSSAFAFVSGASSHSVPQATQTGPF